MEYSWLPGGCRSRTVKQRLVNAFTTILHSFPTPGLQGEGSLPTQPAGFLATLGIGKKGET